MTFSTSFRSVSKAESEERAGRKLLPKSKRRETEAIDKEEMSFALLVIFLKKTALIVSSSSEPAQGIERFCLVSDFKIEGDSLQRADIPDEGDRLAAFHKVSLLDQKI